MTTLHDRLASLADEMPVGPPESDLWQRGRRLHRKRRMGTAVIVAACCLALLGIGAFDWQRSRTEFAPANGDNEYGLPDRIHEPSKWLPGTAGKPFDPLIATLGTERGDWFGSHWAVVGVSATTGEYRFLDLPDQTALDRETALSPNGRYVAYWYSQPIPDYPIAAERAEHGPPVGYAVYDVVNGAQVVREPVSPDRGLMTHEIGWADDRQFVASFSYLLWDGDATGSMGVDSEARLHDTSTGTWSAWPSEWTVSAGNGWFLEWSEPTRLRSVDQPDRVVRLDGGSGVQPKASPSGGRLAGLVPRETKKGTRYTPNPIGVSRLGAERLRLERIPNRTHYYGLLGWRDEDTVLVWRWIEEQDLNAMQEKGMYAVDINTGEEELLAILDQEVHFAAGLLDAPVVSRPDPARPWSPWGRIVSAAVIVSVGGWVLLIWRRRVRP